MADALAALGAAPFPVLARTEVFLDGLDTVRRACGNDYLAAIQALTPELRRRGTAWLQHIVDAVVEGALAPLPGFAGRT
jgi:hypothetical protein